VVIMTADAQASDSLRGAMEQEPALRTDQGQPAAIAAGDVGVVGHISGGRCSCAPVELDVVSGQVQLMKINPQTSSNFSTSA
jgi:hypothetical protein